MDIVDFIDLKKNSGEERRRAHDLFPALWITDLFMERVLEDSHWTLFDPYEVKDLSECFGDEFKAKYIAYENDETITKNRMKAKDLWKKILTSYFESGSPFLCFKDIANKANPNQHAGHIRSSNLCVTGDTKILTKEFGYIEIEKVAGQKLQCWNGEEWSLTDIFRTDDGYGQKVLKVTLSDFSEIEATPYHRWLVKNDYYKPAQIKCTSELNVGDKLVKFDLPLNNFEGGIILDNAYESGFYTADGCNLKDSDKSRIYLYGDKLKLLPFFQNYIGFNQGDNRISLHYMTDSLLSKFEVPSIEYKLESRIKWLSGLLDGDGTLTDNKGTQSVQLVSINKEFLLQLKLMLQELGVKSNISKFKDEGYELLPKNDGTNEYKYYNVKDSYRILIAGSQLNRLLDLGLDTKRLNITYRKYNREATTYIKVTSILDENKSTATYCGSEPKNHTLMFNGHLTMNCTEIFQNTNPNHYKIRVEFTDGTFLTFEENALVLLSDGSYKKGNKVSALDTIVGVAIGEENDTILVDVLPDSPKKVFIVEKERIDGDTAVCNLASVNLSRINSFEDIKRVVPIAIRMLDNVIDLNFYPLRKVKATNLKTRAIGLGVMGEAEMLANSKISWGSVEHFKKIDEIMEAISYNAIESSSNLALEKGSYSLFEGSNWSKGVMPQDHTPQAVNALVEKDVFDSSCDWESLREKVKKDGMRNGYLMAIAPTSSISILVGTTQAIEPVYKRKWFEENLSGLIPVVVPKLSPETWAYYTPAFEIDQLQVIKAAAIRQKWIDQGQSTNIFMSLDKASGKYLHEIYTLAWKLGLKSTYYLRSQSPEAKNDVEDRSMECSGCQ